MDKFVEFKIPVMKSSKMNASSIPGSSCLRLVIIDDTSPIIVIGFLHYGQKRPIGTIRATVVCR
jgi:hypothetical protein